MHLVTINENNRGIRKLFPLSDVAPYSDNIRQRLESVAEKVGSAVWALEPRNFSDESFLKYEPHKRVFRDMEWLDEDTPFITITVSRSETLQKIKYEKLHLRFWDIVIEEIDHWKNDLAFYFRSLREKLEDAGEETPSESLRWLEERFVSHHPSGSDFTYTISYIGG